MKAATFIITNALLSMHVAQGDIILTVSNTSIDSGGTGFADIFIRSTGTDSLSSFDIGLSISDVGSPVGVLQFTDPQADTESSEADYIFNGVSGGVLSNVSTPTTMSQSDFHIGFTDISVAAADLLLGRLELKHVLPGATPPSAADGDQFKLSITAISLFDSAFGSPTVNSTIDGSITASATTAAVPEPSCAMVLSAGFAWCWMSRRRKTGSKRAAGKPRAL